MKQLARYIYENIKMDVARFATWNASDFQDINNGLRFRVDTEEFKGCIDVIYDEGSDTFIMHRLDENLEYECGYSDVYLFEIPETVDMLLGRIEG